MAKRPIPLPASTTSPIGAGPNAPFATTFYAYLKALEAVVSEQAAQIETMRTALNQVRQSPTTVFPPLPPF